MFLEAVMTPALDLSPENLGNIFRLVLTAIFVFALVAAHFFLPNKWRNAITVCTGIFTLIGSLFIYSYGYLQLCSSFVAAVTRTILSTIQAFLGSDDWGDMKDVLKTPTEQTVFWVIHVTALITSAGAIAMAIRKLFTRTIRKWGLRRKDIELIYGLNENTLAFGQHLLQRKASGVVYVDTDPNNAFTDAAWDMGAAVYATPDAMDASTGFLRRLGLCCKDKKLHVYAMSKNYVSNQNYASVLKNSLQEAAVLPDHTYLTLIGIIDDYNTPFFALTKQEQTALETEKKLQQNEPVELSSQEETEKKIKRPLFGRREWYNRQVIADTYIRYGYGNVLCLDEPNMVGRLLTQQYPPCNVMHFDRDGAATHDFHGMVIGFGQVGQAVLRHIVMNSQFVGSTFHAAVFDPYYQQSSGRLLHECSAMFQEYDIEFFPHDGRSSQLYEYLEKHASTLNYIAVCAGTDKINDEIADSLQVYLRQLGCAASIYLCGHRGVSLHADPMQLTPHSIYTPQLLKSDADDLKAMILNHRYALQGCPNTPVTKEQHWRQCDHFSRMSCRSATDFIPAFLAMAHVTREEAARQWSPTGTLRDNLAITEHLRWNAFHYCMGWRPLTDKEFEQKKASYAEDIAKNPDYRITKDTKRRIHGCLCSWKQLKTYAEKENAVTGKSRDYQQSDYNNIDAIGEILQEEQNDQKAKIPVGV